MPKQIGLNNKLPLSVVVLLKGNIAGGLEIPLKQLSGARQLLTYYLVIQITAIIRIT